MSTTVECKLSKSFKDGFRELLAWSYLKVPEYFANVTQGIENLTVLIANRPPSSDEGRTVCEMVNDATREIFEGLQRVSELLVNQTAMIDTLKSRQAVSGAFQAVSLAILVLWLMALATRAVYKCITKKQQADQEEMVEMLEASLARRKAKRRAMGKQTCEPNQ